MHAVITIEEVLSKFQVCRSFCLFYWAVLLTVGNLAVSASVRHLLVLVSVDIFSSWLLMMAKSSSSRFLCGSITEYRWRTFLRILVRSSAVGCCSALAHNIKQWTILNFLKVEPLWCPKFLLNMHFKFWCCCYTLLRLRSNCSWVQYKKQKQDFLKTLKMWKM